MMTSRSFPMRALRIGLMVGLVALTACEDDSTEPTPDVESTPDVEPTPDVVDPPGPTNYSVCCETADETVYTTNVLCEEAGGAEVPLPACPALCCDNQNGSYSWIPPEDCAGAGIPSHPGHCVEVCCELEGQAPFTEFQGNCAFQGGTEVAAEVCEPQEEICCRYVDGTFGLATLDDCTAGSGQQTNAESCEDVCCELGDGTAQIMLAGDCGMQNGTVVDAAVCEPPPEKVCCMQEDGSYAMVPSDDCAADAVVDASFCEPPVEDVCCMQEDGSYLTVPSTECADDAVVDGAMCEAKTCCKTDDGVLWVAEGDCPDGSVLPDGLCDRPFCCKIMDGPGAGNAMMTTSTDCIDQGGSVVYDGYCEQTVCCETDAGNVLVPFMECTFLQVTVASDCLPVQEEACCKIMGGANVGSAILATPSDCAEQGGAFVSDDFCDQEICCNTDTGPQLMPYVECTFLQLTETSACDPPEEPGCCKDMENPGLGDAWVATPEDCFAQGGSPVFQEYCDQEVCCDMGGGPQFMPYSDCTFLAMVATYDDSDTPCDPPEEAQCCKISFGVDTGNVVMATPTDCAEQGGIITVQEYCDQDVCCETDSGMAFVPFLECPFLNVNEDNACTPPEEEGCCQIVFGPDTGNVILAPPTDCAVAYGIPNEMEFCEQIMCCETEAGNALVPFLECPFLDVLALEECPVEEEGCCKIYAGPDTGNVLMATPTDCEVLQGLITEQAYCDQLMCCNTDDGPQQVPFLECAFADVNWEVDACKVCCQTTAWPVVTDQSECEADLVLDDAECDVEVCCSNGEGAFFEGTPTECFAESGTIVDDESCNPPDLPVCCDLGDTTAYLLDSECVVQGGTTTADAQCPVCCEYPGGGVGEDPAAFCIAGGGAIVDDEVCAPDEPLCCAVGEDASYILESACTEQGGTEVDVTECHVCCKNPFENGPEYALEEECDQVQPDEVCDPLVCCSAGDATSYIPTSECTEQAGTSVDLSECQVCCENPFGAGPAYALEQDCTVVVADAVCDPPVCCQTGDETAYVATSACTDGGGTEVDVTECHVCCKNPFGNGPEYALEEECDQEQPDEICDPPDELICCAVGDTNSYILTSECTAQGGATAAASECPVCCQYDGGGVGEDPAAMCLAGGGTIVDDALCAPDEMICCALPTGNTYMLQSGCDEAGASTTVLSECRVCCQYPDESISLDPVDMCLDGDGVLVDEALCDPVPDVMVCCTVGEDSSYILTSECTDQGGAVAADSSCPVCCQDKSGEFSETTAAECDGTSGTVVDDALCEPPDVMICCAVGDTNSYILTSECTAQGGAETGPTECQVCCEYPGGGFAESPATMCDAGEGTVVDDAFCAPPDDPICCAVGEGDASYIPESQCTEAGGAETDLTECQICCKNPFGAGPDFVFEDECAPNDIQPDSVCETDEPK